VRAVELMPGDVVSEVDALTVHTLMMLAGPGVSKAEIRRRLMAEACARARRDPAVGDLVALMMARQPQPEPEAATAPELPVNVLPMIRPDRRRNRGAAHHR
jgi:hypothetical protein